MSADLLTLLLESKIEISEFSQWISGENVKSIDSKISRREFPSYVLNFIQKQTSRLFPLSNDKQVETKSSKDAQTSLTPQEYEKNCVQKRTSAENSPEKNYTRQSFSPFSVPQSRTYNEGRQVSRQAPVIYDFINFNQKQHNYPHQYIQTKKSATSNPMNSYQTPPKVRNHITVSPNSPTYDHNFPDLSSSKRMSHRHGPNTSTDLNDSVSIKSPKKSNPFRGQQRQSGKKRVNPTRIKDSPKELDNTGIKIEAQTFGTAIRNMPLESSPFQRSVTVDPRANYDEERLILKQKRCETLISTNSNSFPNTPIVSLISPDPSKVTHFNDIILLSSIYCIILDLNLVPNITSEIYFIFSLLTVQVKDTSKETEKSYVQERKESLEKSIVPLKHEDKANFQNILDNIHNCVLFAVAVVTKQLHVIEKLDRMTLKLLADNDRLKLYASSFASDMGQIYQKKDISMKKTSSHSVLNVMESTVKFQIDTDNRDNFTKPTSFSEFRKQRDIFYDMLHNWRTKHAEPKRERVLQLLGISNDPINMTHLARLVCCQLINDTMNKTEDDSGTSEEGLLPGITKDKLSLLEARLKNPQGRDQVSLHPPSQFPDQQHFYKCFFSVASENSHFREHAIDCFVTRILEMENTCFEFDESDSRQEEVTLEFRQRVLLSCLLAKFLGLVVFAPYRKLSNLSENVIEAEISVRQKVQPPLDLTVCLQKSINQRSLIKTVPWIVEYLGMMDCVTPFLPCYRPVLQTLLKIYRSVSPYYFSNKKNKSNANDTEETRITSRNLENKEEVSCPSAFLLRLCLGWLFDSSFFPESLFLSLAVSSENVLQVQSERETKYNLDTSDLVDEKCIFECCPYFTQIKQVLMLNARTKGSVRHITPVPAHISQPSESVTATTIQLQLEESFLSGQVASLRTTVDFIKERVASACIKHICNIIAKAKQTALDKIKGNEKKKETISCCVEELKVEIDSTISVFCESRIHSSLQALLSPELLDPKIINISLKITSRRCRVKIVDWLNSHINLADIFEKLTKQIETEIPEDENKLVTCNFDESEPLIEDIIHLKDFICDIIEGEIPDLKEEKILEVLHKLRGSVYRLLLISLSVDLSFVLVAYRPELMTQAVLSEFGALWNSLELTHHGTENPFQRLISPRNIFLFLQRNPTESWAVLSRFLVFLLSKEFLSLKQLEVQCVAIFRQAWPVAVLKCISECLKTTLERVKQENICPNNAKELLMLELVSETGQELEEEPPLHL